MRNRSTTSKNKKIKQLIARETVKSQSFLIGLFEKPDVPIAINQWAAISISNPKFLNTISRELAKLVKKTKNVDLICGVETAGIGIAATTSMKSNIPWIYARKGYKKYGGKEAFEGTYGPGKKLVFVDNMCAMGSGMANIFKNAEQEKMKFNDMIVVLDNNWDKIDEFEKYNVNVKSLITTKEFIDELDKLNYFPGNLYCFMDHYLKDPMAWTIDSGILNEFKKELKKHVDVPYVRQ